jgi:hypothetical protein
VQCRQKHSILSLQKLMMKSAKASGNQAMVRKIRAPGFIFVLKGVISAIARRRKMNQNSIADTVALI